MKRIVKHRPKDGEADLQLIVAQGEAILAKLEIFEQKIEAERKHREEHRGERTRRTERHERTETRDTR